MRPLFALLTVMLIASGGLVVYAIGERRSAEEERPVAIVERKQTPFRGDALPDGLATKAAPDFLLTDARTERPFGTRDVAGKPYVVTFLWVDCPDVCPLIGAELGRALELLGQRGDDVSVLGVSADPGTDTPAAAREWLDRHRLPENFHYLVGEKRELRPVWDAYFAAPQRPGVDFSAHTATIWLVDAQGRIRTKFSAGSVVPPPDLAHDLRVLLREADRRS